MILGNKNRLVAIVVPLSNRSELTNDEKISLNHLIHFLGHYDKYFLLPKSLKFSMHGFINMFFDNSYFGSVDANRRLMFSKKFYKAFIRYKYILIYHLDALVFSDELVMVNLRIMVSPGIAGSSINSLVSVGLPTIVNVSEAALPS